MLRKVTPPSLREKRMEVPRFRRLGLSIANRLFLRQSMPTKGQLAVWDTFVIPLSRILELGPVRLSSEHLARHHQLH